MAPLLSWLGTAAGTLLTWAAWTAAVFSAAFFLACAGAAALVLRRRRPAAGALPPVTILKPLKGLDRGLYENLASFCDQDYPRLQVVFAVESSMDPAIPVAERLKREFPRRDISIVVSEGRIGCNPKINNLSNAYPLARHGLLLISDSDIRVPRDFLRRCVSSIEDPRVGLVTCFYRSAEAASLWGNLETFSVNIHFLPQALLAAAFGMRFAMGAAMLVRRSVFDRIGGFAALADHLADDFALGAAVKAAGWRVEFSDVVVESVPPQAPALAQTFRHQARWQRTLRLCNPAGYGGSWLLHGFTLATLALLLAGWNAGLAAMAAALLLAKVLASAMIQRLSGFRQRLAPLLWLPLSEWLAFCAWICAFGPSAVSWRGSLYRVLPDGRLVPARSGLPPAARRPVSGPRLESTPAPLAVKP